jgi:hypothetical protein
MEDLFEKAIYSLKSIQKGGMKLKMEYESEKVNCTWKKNWNLMM